MTVKYTIEVAVIRVVEMTAPVLIFTQLAAPTTDAILLIYLNPYTRMFTRRQVINPVAVQGRGFLSTKTMLNTLPNPLQNVMILTHPLLKYNYKLVTLQGLWKYTRTFVRP